MSIGKTQWGDASLPWREVKCIIQTIQQYLQFPFIRYVLVVGTPVTLCSLLLGVTLVLKRFSFVGDRLSHVAFGAMLIAGVLHITNDMLFVMLVLANMTESTLLFYQFPSAYVFFFICGWMNEKRISEAKRLEAEKIRHSH